MAPALPGFESIQPIVLAGGRSQRFGRDKLREPIPQTGNAFLVDRPIAALREVFGPRVAVVGECHPDVAARADLSIPDRYPGLGPIGGILSALERTGTDVFVLAGDLVGVTAAAVRRLLDSASGNPAAWAVLAQSDRIEPCIGLYRAAAAAALRSRLESGESTRLHDAIPPESLLLVPIDAAECRNVNTPADLCTRKS